MVGRWCERSVHPPVVRSKYAEYRTNQCGLRVAVLGTRVFIRSTGACFPTLRVPSVPAPASRTPRGRVPLLPCPMLPSLRSSALRSFVSRPSVLRASAVRSSLVRVSAVRSMGVRSLARSEALQSGSSEYRWTRSDCSALAQIFPGIPGVGFRPGGLRTHGLQILGPRCLGARDLALRPLGLRALARADPSQPGLCLPRRSVSAPLLVLSFAVRPFHVAWKARRPVGRFDLKPE